MADNVTSPPRKVSRYRSQRQQAQQEQELINAPAVPAIPQTDAHDEDGVLRSKSRYRRKHGTGSDSRPATAGDQDQISLSHRPGTEARSPPSQSPLSRVSNGLAQHSPVRSGQDNDDYRSRHASPPARPGAVDARHGSEDNGSQEMLQVRTRSSGRGPVPVSSLVRPQLPPSIPSGELFPPPKPPPPVHVDGPPSSSQINATKSTPVLPVYHDDEDESKGCFGLFKRKRGDAATDREKLPIARPVSNDGPQAILVGGGGIVPGTDAPVSAVNAGDRRVLVECGKSKMLFPVTPTTTPVELIKSASIAMSEPINARSAVLLEMFNTVGVQRPLRRYEHIRDVMNSWDSDRQSSLLLIDPRTGTSEIERSLAGVPKVRPDEATFLMHYSQKVGSWDKRFVTLKADGQITCQKDADKPRDQVNVCHMSDFDIYSPTIEKIRKKIKPPKKNCFAIKSQQKTSMFESTQNFVHFFCTNDRRTADDFYNAVQGWRSWYLVNVMGEGVKAKPTEETHHSTAAMNGHHDISQATAHRKMDSMDSHYQLGSFRPLVDMDQFNERPATSDGRPMRTGSRSGAPQRHSSTRVKAQHPPLALNKALLADDEPLSNLARRASVGSKRGSMDVGRPDQLDLGDRLGRTYSQRQRNGNAAGRQDWTTSHNILNDNSSANNPSTRLSTDGLPTRRTSLKQPDDLPRRSSRREPNPHRRNASIDLDRSTSRSGPNPHKPLIDLTPAYKEPPQHASKGRAHRPDALSGPGTLIEAATSPDNPIGAPPSTDWRGRNGATSSPAHAYRPPTSQNCMPQAVKSVHRPAQSTSPEYGAPVSGPAFTGDGLLAGSPQGWGGGERGRGVRDGSRAKGPLVDFSGESRFAQGGLLGR